MRQKLNRLGWSVMTLGMIAAAVLSVGAASAETIGKNPGQIKGRWLEVKDPSVLAGYQGVYLGAVKADIHWKKESNDQPMEEDLLTENLQIELLANLRESGVLGKVLTEAPAEGATGYLRLDCDLEVEPGSRAARYAVGLGAGKSRSILEIHLRDHESGAEVGRYHGHGIGSGMGFKLAGGGARKMTQDDNQENAKEFVRLLAEIK